MREHRVGYVWVALDRSHRRVTAGMLDEIKGRMLFGEPRAIERWQHQVQRGSAALETWRLPAAPAPDRVRLTPLPAELRNNGLPLALKRRVTRPIDRRTELKADDVLYVLVAGERADEVGSWLREGGWERVASEPVG